MYGNTIHPRCIYLIRVLCSLIVVQAVGPTGGGSDPWAGGGAGGRAGVCAAGEEAGDRATILRLESMVGGPLSSQPSGKISTTTRTGLKPDGMLVAWCYGGIGTEVVNWS
jgi:hypothetical protein